LHGKGNKKLTAFFFAFFWVLSISSVISLEMQVLPSEKLIPGSAVIIIIKGINGTAAKLNIGGNDIPLVYLSNGEAMALWGLDLHVRGKMNAVFADGKGKINKEIIVEDYEFPAEMLTLPPDKVFLSEKDLMRVEKEKEVLDNIWNLVSPEKLWNGMFMLPVGGAPGSRFGLRRIINGEERNPHTGMDIIAAEGTPVMAVNRGKVIFEGDLFFSGNSVVIDHGLGLYSMFFHLSKVLVKVGDLLEKGTPIGYVGATGRVSGPHLHFGFRLLNAKIDPQSMLNLNLDSGRQERGITGP